MPTKFFIGADEWAGLSKLFEEAGEVVQVAGKLMGSDGAEQHWDGSNLRVRLIEELGDLTAAIRFFVKQNINDGDADAMLWRAEAKEQLFHRWHRDQTTKDLV